MPVRAELEREGAIRVWREGRVEKAVADRAPDMQPFSLSEIAIVDWWIDHIATYETAESISQKSHDYTWQIAAMGEELPMVATFARRIRAPSEEETRLAKETAAKLGLP
jgi:hypothetical protein